MARALTSLLRRRFSLQAAPLLAPPLLALPPPAREGGSWHVRVSLCQSGMFIQRQGMTGPVAAGLELSAAELGAFRMVSETATGRLKHLAPVLRLSETPPRWARPTPVLGGDAPAWLREGDAVAAE